MKTTKCDKIEHCIYGGKAGGIHICNYMSLMGKRRPCPPDKCTEFKEGENMRDPVAANWSTLEEKERWTKTL